MLPTTNRPAQVGFLVGYPVNSPTASVVPDPCAITAKRLQALVPTLSADAAALHAGVLEEIRPVADLMTPQRVRHFIAQAANETGGFSSLVENLRYRDAARLDKLFSRVNGLVDARQLIAAGPRAIANRVYANRLGNGSEASGDGYRFRGRGYLQITFRNNYREFGAITGQRLEEAPERLEDPAHAAASAALYWRQRKINDPADRDDALGVTRLINPALAGLDDRRAWLGLARKVWP